MTKKLIRLDGSPVNQGWYWCCEGYAPYAMGVYWITRQGGHNDHELTYEEADNLDADWWGPIQSPEEPAFYGDKQ